MAGRTRRGEEPLAVRAARERERHLAGVAAFGFFLPRRPRRSVTVTLEGGQLYGEPTGSPKRPLAHVSGTTFSVTSAPIT